jgi:hypothetical protein
MNFLISGHAFVSFFLVSLAENDRAAVDMNMDEDLGPQFTMIEALVDLFDTGFPTLSANWVPFFLPYSMEAKLADAPELLQQFDSFVQVYLLPLLLCW